TNGQVKQVSQLSGAVVIGDVPVEAVFQSQQIGNVMPVLVQAVLLGLRQLDAECGQGPEGRQGEVQPSAGQIHLADRNAPLGCVPPMFEGTGSYACVQQPYLDGGLVSGCSAQQPTGHRGLPCPHTGFGQPPGRRGGQPSGLGQQPGDGGRGV